MASNGRMTLRYGLQRDNPERPEYFRFDVDRYRDGPFDVPNTCELLGEFALDIYAVFIKMVGPKLSEWMEPRESTNKP